MVVIVQSEIDALKVIKSIYSYEFFEIKSSDLKY